MKLITIKGRKYRLIPFLITTGVLLFCFFLIAAAAYKYHLETEERRLLLETNIEEKAKELNKKIHDEILILKKENENFKSTPYEFLNSNGDKEYYNLFTQQLVKTIKKDNSIVWSKKYDGANIKQYITLGATLKDLKDVGFSAKELRSYNYESGAAKEFYPYGARELKDVGFSLKELKDAGCALVYLKYAGYSTKELRDVGFTLQELFDAGFSAKELKDAVFDV